MLEEMEIFLAFLRIDDISHGFEIVCSRRRWIALFPHSKHAVDGIDRLRRVLVGVSSSSARKSLDIGHCDESIHGMTLKNKPVSGEEPLCVVRSGRFIPSVVEVVKRFLPVAEQGRAEIR